MENISFYLFDNGPPKKIPGFKKGISLLSFPFWGDYFFLDFTILNWKSVRDDSSNLFIVLEGINDRSLLAVSERLNSGFPELLRLDNGIEVFLDSLKRNHSDYVFLGTSSNVCIIDFNKLFDIAEKANNNIIKLSIGSIPVDLYIAERKELVKLIMKNRRKLAGTDGIIDYLFDRILLTDFTVMENLEGTLFFRNNLMQIYRSNMWLIENIGSVFSLEIQNKLNSIININAESFVSGDGFVRNSVLSSRVEIKGSAENSIIFPGVRIGKNSRVINSVLMSGNNIGDNSLISNTIIFPSINDHLLPETTIGEGVTIGNERSSVINRRYPEQINSGITVLGFNPEIPDGYQVEAGCYIGPDVPFEKLRRHNKLTKGSSIFSGENNDDF